MPRILILRTFKHSRVWEGTDHIIYDNVSICHYEKIARDIILTWEPNISNYTLDDFTHAWGLYNDKYFSGENGKNSDYAFLGTEGEEHPSLLQLMPIKRGSNTFLEDDGKQIKIAFTLINKMNDIHRNHMLQFDRTFINLKRNELNEIQKKTDFPSLCFSIPSDNLYNIRNQIMHI